jgi:hypothetical protein
MQSIRSTSLPIGQQPAAQRMGHGSRAQAQRGMAEQLPPREHQFVLAEGI